MGDGGFGDGVNIICTACTTELPDLPKQVLQRVLSYCTYAEVTRCRLVSRAWRAATERVLNSAFFGLKERVETHVRSTRLLLQQYAAAEMTSPFEPMPGEALLVGRFVKLLTLQSELHILHAVVARYVLLGKYAFAGGRVLDIVQAALPDSADDLDFDARDMSTLFFYNSLYLDHFERCVEPALAGTMGALEERYGPKVVDLLCCSLCAGHQFVLAYDGTIVSVIGVFRVVERGASAPPALPGRCDHDDARCSEVMRYLRGEIRWTNLTAARDAARYGRAADVLYAVPAPAAALDAAGPVDVLPAGIQRMLDDSLTGDELLYERLFRRQLLRPRMGEGVTVSLDLKCRRTFMPALLRREVDAFDAARARDARAEAPERDCPSPAPAPSTAALTASASASAVSASAAHRAQAPPSGSAPAARHKRGHYEFAMLLRARYYQSSRDTGVAAHPPDLAILGTRLQILCLESPRRTGPLLQTQLSLYQARGLTALVPGVTKSLEVPVTSVRYVPRPPRAPGARPAAPGLAPGLAAAFIPAAVVDSDEDVVSAAASVDGLVAALPLVDQIDAAALFP